MVWEGTSSYLNWQAGYSITHIQSRSWMTDLTLCYYSWIMPMVVIVASSFTASCPRNSTGITLSIAVYSAYSPLPIQTNCTLIHAHLNIYMSLMYVCCIVYIRACMIMSNSKFTWSIYVSMLINKYNELCYKCTHIRRSLCLGLLKVQLKLESDSVLTHLPFGDQCSFLVLLFWKRNHLKCVLQDWTH